MGRLLVLCLLLATGAGRAGAADFEEALDQARRAGALHRYDEVVAILLPYAGDPDPEQRYAALAEVGRAWFHLGRYEPARRAFREAAAIHPERAETAIYLQASSYLTGDREQALLVFRALLESGARDLYHVVTLSGGSRFLADPAVQELLARHAVPIAVDPAAGTVMGIALGTPREEVRRRLGLGAEQDRAARSLSAEAGPALIWAFLFDDAARLAEVILHAANMAAFTPYRLQFGPAVDWRASPAAVVAVWGPPALTTPGNEGDLTMTWCFADHDLSIGFAVPEMAADPVRPPGAGTVGLVRLAPGRCAAPARMER